jgi:hypothetical protein
MCRGDREQTTQQAQALRPRCVQEMYLAESTRDPELASFGEAPSARAGFLTRMLWSCAGADASVLERCPHSDSVKFQGMGGVVLATAVLAFASGSYAFYTVFEPKTGTALGRELHVPTLLLSIVAGIIWGLVIFNLDRFIVSSTGKGDGTERITFGELFRATPRLVMAILLGVCISAPLEIRILKPEIDAQLELEQNEYLAQLNTASDRLFADKSEELRKRMTDAMQGLGERESYFERRRLEINEQRRSLELEAEGRTKSGVAGRGPAWRDKRDTLDQMLAELERDREREAARSESVSQEVEHWKAELATIDERLNAARESNLKQARHLDGLMKRIQISHEIGGWVPVFILLLLLAIETGPIFFKMMLRRGAYDYLQEAEARLATARAGVEIDAQIYAEGTREEVRVDVYHPADAAMVQVRRRLAKEAPPTEAPAPALRVSERS